MENPEFISIKIRKIKEEYEGFFVEPEEIDGEIYELRNSDLINIINFINKNDEDVSLIAEDLLRDLDSILNDLPRPEKTGIVWQVIKRHAPDPLWPSITYFGPAVVRQIVWHVSLENPKIKNLIDLNILRIEYL
ncbi:hypothetical protein [uncultured Roseibium sp.]|uniref:hypothetical protein n=1 Tax=uncultured Roseibium sp. TaxID=1936171 RepID=UPI00321776F9